jgi:hypothetical protein
MKVFLSWSGRSSRQIAEILYEWIPRVIQAVEPYLSSQDIEKGERWLSSVSNNLESIDFGIVVLTPTNIAAPWINFEAGALSKKIDRSRLIPVLFEITDTDLVGHPLSQFQYVKLDKEDILRLFRVLNQSSVRPLPENQFDETFALWFEKYSSLLSKIEREKGANDKKGVSIEDSDARMQKLEAAVDELLKLQRRQAMRSAQEDVYDGFDRNLRNALVHSSAGVGKSSYLIDVLERALAIKERAKDGLEVEKLNKPDSN